MDRPITYPHIVLDEAGVAWIEGSTTKVVELVVERRACGWSPEELAYQHPTLSLGQIFSALAYSWDHRDALEAELIGRLSRADALRSRIGDGTLAARLRTLQPRERSA